MNLGERLTEALAWRAAAELVRRHPEDDHPWFFWRVPGAGPPGYFALRFAGTEVRFMPEWEYWEGETGSSPLPNPRRMNQLPVASLTQVSDWSSWARQVEESLGISSPSETPSTTPVSVGFRIAAHLLMSSLGDRGHWTARPGEIGWSNEGSSWPGNDFDAYQRALGELWRGEDGYGYPTFLWHIVPLRTHSAPPTQADPGRRMHAPVLQSPERNWMSWYDEDVPGAYLAPQRGRALASSGEVVALYPLYEQQGRSLTATAAAFAALLE